MRKERKIIWIFPSKNINRCAVRLVEKYLGLCPKNYVKKQSFYLQSLKCPTPKQWYGREVIGANKIKEVVKQLLSSAKIDGYLANHSLCRSGGSRLFQAGIDRKIVKEMTEHRSDALDCYQITSEEQRERVSEVLQGPCPTNISVESDKVATSFQNCDKTRDKTVENCTCKCKIHDVKTNNIGQIVSDIESRHLKTGKTIIKLEIEMNTE